MWNLSPPHNLEMCLVRLACGRLNILRLQFFILYDDIVFQYSDPKYLAGIQTAVEQGNPCLLENVGESLDPGMLGLDIV